MREGILAGEELVACRPGQLDIGLEFGHDAELGVDADAGDPGQDQTLPEVDARFEIRARPHLAVQSGEEVMSVHWRPLGGWHVWLPVLPLLGGGVMSTLALTRVLEKPADPAFPVLHPAMLPTFVDNPI